MARPRIVAENLRTSRLDMEPLRVAHAKDAAAAFDNEALHTFIGGAPASVDQLRARYERQVVGQSADGSEIWLNWMLRRIDTGELIGTTQATLTRAGETAEVAWVVGVAHQHQGYAREAAAKMVEWLQERGVERIVAHIHPEHRASAEVAQAIGLHPTEVVVDGEERWDDS